MLLSPLGQVRLWTLAQQGVVHLFQFWLPYPGLQDLTLLFSMTHTVGYKLLSFLVAMMSFRKGYFLEASILTPIWGLWEMLGEKGPRAFLTMVEELTHTCVLEVHPQGSADQEDSWNCEWAVPLPAHSEGELCLEKGN